MKNSPVRFWALIFALLLGGLFINWFETRGEVTVARRPLAEIPSKLGDWERKGTDFRFSEATESVLKATDYVNRYYYRDGRRIDLYIGYYASQKTGSTYHSPQNYLPGAGWEMRAPELITVKTSSGRSFHANKYIIENGKYKEIMIYWYQGRGRFTASEYSDKLYTIWDSLTRSRSDASMIRLMTGVGGSETNATEALIDFASQTADKLDDFVPR